ncbi:hypothetical protein ACFQZE_07520 [Paenibacillus sp. GCM10027627]|uniref:hypothetical protein n=1 Tax=unclassified Paenibacillus TaxID=185978 RepID=UPI003640C46B
MNIGQLMRGLLGDAAGGETRAMELKIGQVVRGVVLQSFENNEALVQINGVQVRAKLEMPLVPGQSAMLQVQPESSGSLVLLKAIDLSASGLLDDTFRDLAKRLGMPDQKWALDIIKDLRREGFDFNRATIKAFQEAASVMPSGADPEQWMTATAAAFKRGLPMTAATIAAMGQTMFGKGAHELLNTLNLQLSAFMTDDAGNTTATADGARQAAAKVLAALEQGAALLRTVASASGGVVGQGEASGGINDLGSAKGWGGAPLKEGAIASPDLRGSATSGTSSQPAGDTEGATNSAAMASGRQAATQTGSGNWLGGMLKWLGVDHELQLAKAATAANTAGIGDGPDGESLSARATTDNNGPVLRSSAQMGTSSSEPGEKGTAAAAAQGASSAGNGDKQTDTAATRAAANARGDHAPTSSSLADIRPGGNGDQRAAQQVPAGNGDQRAALQGQTGNLALQTGLPGIENRLSDVLSQQMAQGANAQSAQGELQGSETLKSALMALTGTSDIPPAIKETAQGLINHITGQQLMLTPERNSSVFTHVTMFIPLQDQSGGTTASVHIQTRRGKRGELDAENCRLLFNLSMKALGDTLVDVNVANKIVSLNIWNDHPAIHELMNGGKSGMSERLQAAGYQLLSLRTTPLPSRTESEAAVMPSGKGKNVLPPDLSQFASTRYKGVDYRA